MAKQNLLGKDLDELQEFVERLQLPAYRARQIFRGMYHRRWRSLGQFTDLSKPLRAKLDEGSSIDYLPLARVFQSRDGTRRYLFEVVPGQHVESVLIPESRRDTFCISTQVGCAVECLFCVTGKLPMRRNLLPGEILSQILYLQDDREDPGKRLNVVFMGMGEPLHNYDNVMKAFRLMIDSDGIALSHKRITLSTAGVVPMILRLAKEPKIPNLAISLNATTDETRDILIPINRKWNIHDLLAACRSFPLEPRRRITIEYVLIDRVNDTPDDAIRLAQLLTGLRAKVNLIPLNSDPWIPLGTPGENNILAFQEILSRRGISAYIRKPRGRDISAACGMLAGREQSRGDMEHPPPKPAKARDLVQLGIPQPAGR